MVGVVATRQERFAGRGSVTGHQLANQVSCNVAKSAANTPSSVSANCCSPRGVPILNSLRMRQPRLCAAAAIEYRLATFSIPRSHVRLAPPVSQT